LKNLLYLLIIAFLAAGSISAQQITGLAGWNIYLDPGHSQKENMGIYNYSEAEKNLRVALNLRQMLLEETDIDTVYICRTNDQQVVSLSQRTDQANALGAAWYHSIHSDAGSSTSNSTLLLWGQYKDGREKVPNGGNAMSDIMIDKLTDGMRTNTVYGSIGDCSFYGCTSSGPYLHVNRESNMPSELSEAGFHTNPTQNQKNMNADWKRLEARTFFWSILQKHGIAIPTIRILTGIVSDAESSVPLNGAILQSDGRTYTTDTYESMFYQYSSDPGQLHNGVYYFEDITTDSAEIMVSVPEYEPDTVKVKMSDTFFTFRDFRLVSTKLPVIVSTTPAAGDTSFPKLNEIIIKFNRPMNKAAVDSNFSIEPQIDGKLSWADGNKTLKFKSDYLDFTTWYTITIPGFVTDNYNHPLDGNGDGTPGDDFVLIFRTGYDGYAPILKENYPASNKTMVELKPIISLIYDEEIDPQSITPDIFKLERFKDKSAAPGTLQHYVAGGRSILNFFPSQNLYPKETYVARIYAGLSDYYGNSTTAAKSVTFVTGDYDYQVTSIDNFEAGVDNWWAPEQSGSSTGYDPGISRGLETEKINLVTNSTKSMRFYYDWKTDASDWLIREYLGGGAPRNVTFDKSYIMQVYIFGDKSGNAFRFAVDDNNLSGQASDHEVSPWYTIDWYGWKLVQWDMTNDSTGLWLGDGSLDGTMRFDSFQFTYNGVTETGTIYLDDLRLVKKTTATEISEQRDVNLPREYSLSQNYPNPFNPVTEIRVSMPEAGEAVLTVYNMLGQKVAIVFEGGLTAGWHQFKWDGQGFASGSYVYELRVNGHIISKKMTLMK